MGLILAFLQSIAKNSSEYSFSGCSFEKWPHASGILFHDTLFTRDPLYFKLLSCENRKELQPQIFRFFISHKYLPAHQKQRKSKMLGELMWWVGMEWLRPILRYGQLKLAYGWKMTHLLILRIFLHTLICLLSTPCNLWLWNIFPHKILHLCSLSNPKL